MVEEISPLEDHAWWMSRLREAREPKQPEALRLADILQHKIPSIECLEKAAAELRRLHAVNRELMESLREVEAELKEEKNT